jgi:hypothetical protein
VRVAVLVVLLAVAVPGIARPAEGQPLPVVIVEPDASGSGTTEPPSIDSPPTQPPGGVPGDILPGPEAGPEPDDPGDRGGWLQLSILGLVVAAIAGITLLVWRESRSRRRDVRH